MSAVLSTKPNITPDMVSYLIKPRGVKNNNNRGAKDGGDKRQTKGAIDLMQSYIDQENSAADTPFVWKISN